MPKATITFNLPEETSEYKMHMKAGDYHSLIWEFTNFLRNKTKYATGEEGPISWEDVRTEWWRQCQDEGVDPYGD